MSGALPLDLLIDITSRGVKDTFSIGKLNTIIIEKYNDDLPNKKFVECFDLDTTQSIFGFEAPATKFAEVYFGVISKSATKCDRLFVYNWNDKDIPPALKGGIAPSVSELQKLNGKFKIDLGSGEQEVTLNLTTGQNQDYAKIATLIENAIKSVVGGGQQFTNAKVTYNPHTKGFIIKSGKAGAGEVIKYPIAGTSNDIHNKLGLTLEEGAVSIEGLAAVSTIDNVLNEIDKNNGNYYLITPNFEFEIRTLDTNLKAFGVFLNNSNDRYAGVYSWNNPLLESLDSKVTEPYEGFNGLIIDSKHNDYQNALVCALISAMDLSKPAGNYNIAFNDATQFQINAIVDKVKYNAMKVNKANAPCKFGILGQDDTIYMDGTILGTKTDSINVYICNSFLKMNLQINLYNMFKAQKLIGLRDKRGKDIIKSYMESVFQGGVNANIIAQGAVLTTTEKNVIIDNFKNIVSDIDKVLTQIENTGYYYEIADVNVTTRELTIVMAYVANTPVKKIVINNYILGA